MTTTKTKTKTTKTQDQLTEAIIAHRRCRKAAEAFSVLVASGMLGDLPAIEAVIGDLQYGRNVLDTLARLTGRKTFSRDTALVLRDLLSQHHRDVVWLSQTV